MKSSQDDALNVVYCEVLLQIPLKSINFLNIKNNNTTSDLTTRFYQSLGGCCEIKQKHCQVMKTSSILIVGETEVSGSMK